MLFYFAGTLLALLGVTVFHIEGQSRQWVLIAVALIAFSLGLYFLIAGSRANRTFAIVLLTITAAVVIGLVILAPNELRALNSGLLFYSFQVYTAWFAPIWYARAFGIAWLTAYVLVIIIRFDSDMHLILVTLVLSSIVIGELLGVFRRKLERNTLTDPLCGVWNKRGFGRMLDRAIDVVQRSGEPTTVVFIDIDNFKAVNDSFGHAEGDRVLRSFAAQLEQGTRSQDVIGRLGGDEFALLLENTTAEQAMTTVERLREATSECQWSAGVAQLQPDERAESLLARADQLMFNQKRERSLR